MLTSFVPGLMMDLRNDARLAAQRVHDAEEIVDFQAQDHVGSRRWRRANAEFD